MARAWQGNRRTLLKASAGAIVAPVAHGLLTSKVFAQNPAAPRPFLVPPSARQATASSSPIATPSLEAIYPNDPRYAGLVVGTNSRWVGTPAWVSLCATPDEVVQALAQARTDGKRITVRSGGHCYEDFVMDNPDGVIIDVSPMSGVWQDSETGWWVVQSGAMLGDVYLALYHQGGVTLPGGSCSTVGTGGHISGGGYGLLSRLHGLTVDYLRAVDLVYVSDTGTVETITARYDDPDPDVQELLWAHTGGGGGNFGIVTAYSFGDLPKAPEQQGSYSATWDWNTMDRASFGEIVTNFGTFQQEHGTVDDPWDGLFSILIASQQASGQVSLIALNADDTGDPEPLLALMKALNLPQDTSQITTSAWIDTIEAGGPISRSRGKYKSAYMTDVFPEAQIDAMWQQLTNPSHVNPAGLVQIDSYGGKVNAVDPSATAVSARSSIMKLQYQCYWPDEADDDANLAWMRAFYEAMYGASGPLPDGVMDGCYVNYPDVDLESWAALYYGDNYPRLQQVKARWDPSNAFSHAQSITLPG
ncbi:MAG: FAD-binding oxidoreductase [Thermomicrobiales bacterium]